MKSRYINCVLMAILLLLSVFPVSAGAAPFKEVPGDYISGDNFGYSVSIDGNYAVVGSKNAGISDIGAIYIYQLNSSAWTEVDRLDPDDGQSGDQFGTAVAVSGNYIIVGSPQSDVRVSNILRQNAGSAYIFDRDGLPLAKIFANDATTDDNSGTSVDISDSFAVVGVPFDDDNAKDNSGSVIIYKKPEKGWAVWKSLGSVEKAGLQTKLTRGASASGNDFFGNSVAIAGDRIIVGVPGADYLVPENSPNVFYSNVGSVYIYYYDGTQWTEEKQFKITDTLSANNNTNTFNFGKSVAIYGNSTDGYYAIIGAKGQAFALYHNGSSWSELQRLEPPPPGTENDPDLLAEFINNQTSINYGVSVSIGKDYAIVGADKENSDKGATYIYKFDGSNWTEQTDLQQVPSSLLSGDQFGYSVGISGELTVVGAPGTDTYVPDTWVYDTGAAYFSFAVDEATFNYPPAIDAIDDTYVTDFGSVSIPITVYDDVSATAGVTVSAEALNPDNIGSEPAVTPSSPSLNLTDGIGTGSVNISPQTDVYGYFEITVTVSDGTKSATETFVFGVSRLPTFDPVNPIPDKEMAEDATPLSFSFKVYDEDGDALTVSAVSDNQDVLPDANILINGYVSPYTTTLLTDGDTFSRSLTMKLDPPLNANGTANVTVTVTDGSGDVSDSFVLTVTSVNDPHEISDIPNKTVLEDSTLGPFSFTITDVDSDLASLQITATSNNPDLIPDDAEHIIIDQTDADPTLTIIPAPDANSTEFGTATITVVVSEVDINGDPIDPTVSDTFTVTVTAVTDKPVFSNVPSDDADTPENPQTIIEGGGSLAVPTIILRHGDHDGTPNFVWISAASGNQALVPDANISINGISGASYYPVLVDKEAELFVIITPEPNLSGTAVITLTATDTAGANVSVAFDFEVTDFNDPPVINPIGNQSINEDGVLENFAFTISDQESAGNVLWNSITVTSSNTELVPDDNPTTAEPDSGGENIVIGGSGTSPTLTITPVANMFGTTVITVKITDDGGKTATETFILSVTSVNDIPEIVLNTPSPVITDEDTKTGDISFTVSDIDKDDLLTITATAVNQAILPIDNDHVNIGGSGMTHMMDVNGGSGNFTMTLLPAENANGNTSVTVTVNDGKGGTDVAVFQLKVNPVNDPPTIDSGIKEGDIFETDEDIFINIDIVINDVDTAISSLVPEVVPNSTDIIANTSIRITGAGANYRIKLTPNENKTGTAELVLSVNDNNPEDAKTTSVTFYLEVKDVNDAPVFTAPANYSVHTTDEDTEISIPVSLSDVEDTNADNITLTAVSNNTALVPNNYNNLRLDGTGNNRTLVITPAKDAFTPQNGIAEITITADDNSGSATATSKLVVKLQVNPVNDPPAIEGISNNDIIPADEDTPKEITITLSDADTPVENIELNWSTPVNCTITASGLGASRILKITPNSDFSGPINITLTADDGEAQNNTSAPVSFTLNVGTVNDAPFVFSGLVANQLIVMNEDTSEDIEIVLEDVDTEAENITAKVTSGNTNLIPNLYANLRITGTEAARTIYIRPKENANTHENGTATITLELNDNTGTETAVSTLVFTVEVTQINDPPVITNIDPAVIITTPEKTEKDIAITLTDPDTPLGQIVLSAKSSNQNVVPDANIRFTGTLGSRIMYVQPADYQYGILSIEITADDQEGTGTSTSVLTITFSVGPVNDPPSILGIDPFDVVTFSEDLETEGTKTFEIPFRVEDVEQVPHQLTVSVKSGNTNLVADAYASLHVEVIDPDDPLRDECNIDLPECQDNPVPVPAECICNRKLVIVPEPDANTYDFGTGTITMTVDDNTDTETATSDFTFTIEVNPVNDPPEISGISEGMIVDAEEDVAASIPVTLSDKESAPTLIGLTAVSGNETLVQNTDIRITGTGADRSIVITPQTDQSGDVPITITANDNSGAGNAETAVTFKLRLNPVNDSPSVDTGHPNNQIKPNAVVEMQEDENKSLTVVVADLDTDPLNITVTAESDNTFLIPNEYMNIHVEPGAEDDERIIVINPADNANTSINGTAKITLTIDDNTGTATATNTMTFTVNVQPVNDAPGITGISKNQIFPAQEDVELEIPFTLTDIDSLVENITVTPTSSDETILPTDYAHAHITGGGANRILVLKPAANQSGMVSVTLTADDGGTGDSSYSLIFKLAVEIANDPPAITGIVPNQVITMEEDTTKNIVFRVDDVDTALSNVTVFAVSSNEELVPNEFSYLTTSEVLIKTDPVTSEEYGEVTLTVKPLESMNSALAGNTEITITANDNTGGPTASNTLMFVLRVLSGNDGPVISSATSSWTMNEDESKDFTFTVNDVDKDELSLTITSTNASVLPTDGQHILVNGQDYADGFKIREPVYSAGPITLTLIPVENANTGINPSTPVTLSVTVADPGGDTADKNFILTVLPVSDPPVIFITPGPKVTPVNTPITVTFRVDDPDTPIAQLQVNADSKNTTLVPLSNITGPTYITLAGANDPNYTMDINPALDETGTADIEIQVYDGLDPDPTTATFTMTVYDVTSASDPQIFVESPVYTSEDVPVTVIFTIIDEDTGVDEFNKIDVHPVTQDAPLIPYENIVQPTKITPQPADPREHTYQVTIRPGTNVSGSVELEILVVDVKNQPAPLQVTKKFTVTIHPINDAPVILDLPSNIEGLENRTEEFDFLIYDPDGGSLTLTTLSMNTELLPNVNIKVTESDDSPAAFPVILEPDERYPLKLILTPKINAFGTATIEVNLRDDSGSVFDTFIQNITYTIGEVKALYVVVDNVIDLKDAIQALKLTAGISVQNVNRGADVNNDTKLGLPEAIFVMQKVAGLR